MLQSTSTADVVDVDSGCCYCCCCCRAAPHSLNVFDIFYEHVWWGGSSGSAGAGAVELQFCRFSCQKSINAAAAADDADDVDVVAASWQASVAQAGRGTWPSYGLLLLANIQMQFMSSSPLLCTHDVSLAMIVVSRSVASCCWYCCCCCCGFCCCCCCCRSSTHKVAMPASWVWEFRFLPKRTE